MRNLPQSAVGSFKASCQDQSSDESPYDTVCPREWPMCSNTSPSAYAQLHHHRSRGFTHSDRAIPPHYQPGAITILCTYLAEHRFGLIVFASVISLITVPLVFVLIYAKKLKLKEQGKARNAELSRTLSQRNRSPLQTQIVFSTQRDMDETSDRQSNQTISVSDKKSSQRITIKLPPTVNE